MAPSDFDRVLLLEKIDNLAALFDPPNGLREAAVAGLQRRSPLPTLERVAFAWDARALFLRQDDGDLLTGFLPLLVLKLSTSRRRGRGTTVDVQVDEAALDRLIEAFTAARQKLAEVRDALGQSGLRVAPPGDPDSRPVNEEWEYLL